MRMTDYEKCYSEKTYHLHIQDLLLQAENVASLNWKQAYWLGKCLYEISSQENTEDQVIDVLVHSTHCGLNMSTDYDKYVEVAQILSRLYMRKKDYLRANNYLMDLSECMNPVQDWVNLYYVLCQILTDTIYRHAEEPFFLYKRLDSVSAASYVQRAQVYQIFLKRLYDIDDMGTRRILNIEEFEKKKSAYIGTYLDDVAGDDYDCLKGIIKKHPDALKNKRNLKGIIADYYPYDELKKNIFCALIEEDIVEELQNRTSLDRTNMKRYLDKMGKNRGINENVVKESILEWCSALGVCVSKEIKEGVVRESIKKGPRKDTPISSGIYKELDEIYNSIL